MSAQVNVSTVQRIFDAFNQGKLDILDEVCSPTYIFHAPNTPDWSREEIKRAIGMMYAAFPDWHLSVDDIFATEDKCAYRFTLQGTHLGELWGVQPTGRKMTWTAIIIDHFAAGKIVEEWEWADFLGLRMQLGLIPEPERVKG